MTTRTPKTLCALVLATLIPLAGSASAQTPPDPTAAAQQYRERASQARAAAAHHKWLARPGRGKQGTGGPSFHHRRLAEQLLEKALEYEKLAQGEEAKGK